MLQAPVFLGALKRPLQAIHHQPINPSLRCPGTTEGGLTCLSLCIIDSSALSDLRKLIAEGVHKSDTVLLLATKGVLSRP
jgi:hypothetical protein